MAFELEHDWQANLATPRARVGERVKTRLLILLCFVWIVMGLIGHEPWKPDEAMSISVIHQMMTGDFVNMTLSPVPIGKSTMETPPLYHLSAAGFAWLFKPLLAMHDAARLVSGVWSALTLLLVGMIGREMWGVGAGRQTTLIFIGSLGLLVTSHMLMPQVSALTGSAMALYALVLADRRPFRASILLGCGVAIAFLSTGLTPALIAVLTSLLLPTIFQAWRTRRYLIVLAIAYSILLVWLLSWLVIFPLLSGQALPDAVSVWWQSNLNDLKHSEHIYYLRTLAWFAWPSLPIAAWGLWRYRRYLLLKPKYQLLLVFFIVSFIVIGLKEETREIHALPLLLPLAALAGGSVETLKRGAAGLLNWFGLMLFGSIGFLVWLGWFAMMAGWPNKLAERMHIISGVPQAELSWLGLLFAGLVTLAWLLVINNYRHSNRATVTDWAVGMTMSWALLMSLWLPWVDNVKSYASVIQSMGAAMPKQYACVTSRNLGSSQQALLDYYINVRTQSFERVQNLNCDLYLIQDERGREKVEPGSDWKLIWQGKRPAERRESFRLFQYQQ